MTRVQDRPAFPRGALARPLAILAIGIVVSATLWAVMLRDERARSADVHLSRDDRAALDRAVRPQ
jgi:hypothetical protein